MCGGGEGAERVEDAADCRDVAVCWKDREGARARPGGGETWGRCMDWEDSESDCSPSSMERRKARDSGPESFDSGCASEWAQSQSRSCEYSGNRAASVSHCCF